MKTILLVDDSAVDRRLFGGLLQKQPDWKVEFADHGNAALAVLPLRPPDIVVTDMQMPGMDGLQLVRSIRSRYPQIPVVLLTGKGSEALATRALQQGAAAYVPKSEASSLLIDTIEHVLSLAHGQFDLERVIGGATQTQLNLSLENDVVAIQDVVALSRRLANGMSVCDATGCLQLSVALEQALLNALYHGNLELSTQQLLALDKEARPSSQYNAIVHQRMAESPYQERKIGVDIHMDHENARFTVRDEGPGFDVKEHADVGLSTSSIRSGRGLFLMWAFMDRVKFNRSGNAVTLIKHRQVIEEEPMTLPETEDQDAAAAQMSTGVLGVLGVLVPSDGSSTIQMAKKRLIVGRDRSCDIPIKSHDISHHHCLLYVFRGWWFVKDLGSKNGVKVNKLPVQQHRLNPGSTLTIGKHNVYQIQYEPHSLGAEGITPPVDPF